MTSVAKPSIVQLTKALAVAGAFVAFGCGTSERGAGSVAADGRGRVWVHQGEAQGTTYTIKYLAQDSVPQSAIDALKATGKFRQVKPLTFDIK